MKLSKKMLKAGWNIIREKSGSYTIFGSNARRYTFTPVTNRWSMPQGEIEHALDKDLEQIQTKKASAIMVASRLTALSHTKQSSEPIRIICRDKLAAHKSVLHFGTGKDRFAKSDLLKSGCSEVVDFDPNFYPNQTVLNKKYDVVIANYVLNILPSKERHDVYRLIKDTLKDTGTAYLTVQGVWPVEHKYQIIKRYQDGYLIKTGFNITFRKGYTPKAFLREIKEEIKGRPGVIKMLYSNTFVGWTKK